MPKWLWWSCTLLLMAVAAGFVSLTRAQAPEEAPGTGKAETEAGEIAARFLGCAAQSLLPASAGGEDQLRVLEDAAGRRIVAVDMRYGRVTRFQDRAAISRSTRPVSDSDLSEAHVAAKRWALAFCPELGEAFDAEAPECIPMREACRLLLFTWQERAGTAYTGKTLVLTIDPGTCRLRTAYLRLPPPGDLPAPEVEEDKSIAIALDWAPRLGGGAWKAASARLVLSHVLAPSEGPVWLVEVENMDNGRHETICIDAVAGKPLVPPVSGIESTPGGS